MMKKRNIFILILLLVTTVVGCKPTIGSNEPSGDNLLTISDYFPFKENLLYDYEGVGNEFAEQKAYFEFIEGDKVQIKVMNPGTNIIRIMEYKDGVLREIYQEGEFYHIENMLSAKETQDNIILKEPIKVGNAWTTSEGYPKSITGIDVEISTPLGNFKALEVTTDLGDGKTQKYYYAKDIGMVASIYDDGEEQIKTLLKSMDEKPLEYDIELFYPFSPEIKTIYINGKIDFYTNQSIEGLLEEKFKNPPNEGLVPVLSPNAKVNSIVLDRSIWAVKVDFSKELITEMNAGSTLEAEILKSLANTLGRFYDVERVFVSVEGEPYESGHYSFIYDEYLSVDIEGIKEFK